MLKTLRFVAQTISYLFHPAFVPSYVVAYWLFIDPYSFSYLNPAQKNIKLFSIFFSTGFFPALTVFLLYRLKFITSIQLRTAKERIVPYTASILFYFWIFYASKKDTQNPAALVWFLFALFIAASMALTLNSFLKISMHAMAMGTLSVLFILIGLHNVYNSGLILSCIILTAGLVCSARLYLQQHSPVEIYTGLVVGSSSQLIAYYFLI